MHKPQPYMDSDCELHEEATVLFMQGGVMGEAVIVGDAEAAVNVDQADSEELYESQRSSQSSGMIEQDGDARVVGSLYIVYGTSEVLVAVSLKVVQEVDRGTAGDAVTRACPSQNVVALAYNVTCEKEVPPRKWVSVPVEAFFVL